MQKFMIRAAWISVVTVGKREMGGVEKFGTGDDNNNDRCSVSSYYSPDQETRSVLSMFI